MDNSYSFFLFVLSHKEKLLLFQGERGMLGGREEGTEKGNFLLGLGCLHLHTSSPVLPPGWIAVGMATHPCTNQTMKGEGIIIHLHLTNGKQSPRG